MASKVVKQLAGSGTGQSLSDMAFAMRFTLSGSVVDKVIHKATTQEYIPPKRKHLAYLTRCTFEPRLSIPDFANRLFSRTRNSNSIVIFKTCVVIHSLMQSGDERFSRYIASNNFKFSESSPNQDNVVARFVRPYAKYLEVKAESYREAAVDLCRIKLRKEDGYMRTMALPQLFKILPVMERQLDALLCFDPRRGELADPLLKFAHAHLYRDLIRIYAVFHEAMINLIEKYFTISKRDCKLALNAYRSFIKRMDSINEFVKLAEATDSHLSEGGTSPINAFTFQPVPTSVLEAMENHLSFLESSRPQDLNRLAANQKPPMTLESSRPTDSQPGGQFQLSEAEQKRIIEEERLRLESFVARANQRASLSSTPSVDYTDRPVTDLLAPLDDSGDTTALGPVATANRAEVVPDFFAGTDYPPAGHAASAFGLPSNFMTHQQQNVLVAPTVCAGLPSGWPQQSSNPFLALSVSSPATTVTANTYTGNQLATGASSTNPFAQTTSTPLLLPQTTGNATNQILQPTTTTQGSEARPEEGKQQRTVVGQTDSPDATVNGGVSGAGSALEVRLAELVDNLSINSSAAAAGGSSQASGQQLPFRAPDGSRTAVNWTGAPSVHQERAQKDPTSQPIGGGGGGGQLMNAGHAFPFYYRQQQVHQVRWTGPNGVAQMPHPVMCLPGGAVVPTQQPAVLSSSSSPWPLATASKPVQPVSAAAFTVATPSAGLLPTPANHPGNLLAPLSGFPAPTRADQFQQPMSGPARSHNPFL